MRAKFVHEGIKHLSPKSSEEIRKELLVLPEEKRYWQIVRNPLYFSDEEITQAKEKLHKLLKSFKDKNIEISYYNTNSDNEIEINVKSKNYEETFYANIDDEEWEKIDPEGVIYLLVTLKRLLKELEETDNYSKKVKEIEDELDARDLTELFGAETYNGWLYEEDDTDKSHEEAVISTAYYCIAKCTAFLDIMSKK